MELQQCVTMACLLDVIAPKPGNVHRGADFEDASFLDFAASAVAIGPIIARSASQPLGQTILQAVQATRAVTNTNTNLGIVLLLAPLAAVADTTNPQEAIGPLLRGANSADAKDVYTAIQLATAGGLGSVGEHDVNGPDVPTSLFHAMELAKDRDRIADLYVTDFQWLFEWALPRLVGNCLEHGLIQGLIASHVEMLANHPDTLIARKCGRDTAKEASNRAAQITSKVGDVEWIDALRDFDFWLRADGNRRNPGTTADLLTAGMFIALYQGLLNYPDLHK